MTTRNQTRLLQLLKEADTLLFDMDNTILDLEELNFYVFKTAIEKYTGLKYTKKDYLEYTLGYRFPENIVLFLQANGFKFDTDLVLKIRNFRRKIKLETLAKEPKKHVRFKKGAKEFLEVASTRYKIGLVTSSALVVTTLLLEKLNITQLFDVVVTGDSVLNGKPHPEPFFTAKQVLKSQITIAFEDSLAGILSAKEANCFTVLVHSKGVNDAWIDKADAVITDFLPLIEFLLSPQND